MQKVQKKWILVAAVAVVCVALVVLLFIWDSRKKENTEKKTEELPTASGDMKDGELVDYEVNGMLTLGKYLERSVTVTPTDTDVYQSILLESEDIDKDKIENGDRVLKGDWISLDYEGYIDDQPSDDLNETGAVIRVGDGNLFNAAFERGLMGLKLGETYTIDVSFPESFDDPDVAGQDVTFSVVVNAKFNDAYAKVLSKNKYETVKDYFDYAKAKEEEENLACIGDTVWEKLVKDCEVKSYPEGSREQAYKDQKRSYQVFAKASGQTYQEFIGALGYGDSDIHSLGDECVRDRMIAKTIAKKAGLEMSDTEYEKYLLAFLEPEEEEDKTLKAMEKRYIEEQSCYPRDDMLIELVKEYIGEHAKVKKTS